jgi:hypothetical protein
MAKMANAAKVMNLIKVMNFSGAGNLEVFAASQ